MTHTIPVPTGQNFSGLFRERDRLEKEIKKAVKKVEAENNLRINRNSSLGEVLEQLHNEEDVIRQEMENDPEVIANSCDGNHPAVVYWGDQLTANDEAADKIRDKINTPYQSEITAKLNLHNLRIEKQENADLIHEAWEICN